MLTMVSTSMFLFIFTFIGYPLVYCGCKSGKEEGPSREWKMMESDVVAHGIVISTNPDPIPAKDTYSVLFEVRCSYKGGPLPELIRINKISYNADCPNSSLTEGPKFLVYLTETDNGQYVQRFDLEAGDSQTLDEMPVLCEASVEYPIGKNVTSAKERCPEKYMYEDCYPRPEPTNPPYDNGDNQKDAQGSEETVDQKTKEKPDGGKFLSKPIPSSDGDGDNGSDEKPFSSSVGDNGSSVTSTLNMSAMILLLLAVILQ